MALVTRRAHPIPLDAAVAAERQAAHAHHRQQHGARDPAARNLRKLLPPSPRIRAMRARHCRRRIPLVDEPRPLRHRQNLVPRRGLRLDQLLVHCKVNVLCTFKNSVKSVIAGSRARPRPPRLLSRGCRLRLVPRHRRRPPPLREERRDSAHPN